MRGVAAVFTVSLVVPFSTLSAQRPPPVAVGERVRIAHSCTTRPVASGTRTDCRQDAGTLTAVTIDSVVLRHENGATLLSLPLTSVASLDISRGKRSQFGRGALIGLGVGVAGGGILGLVGGLASDHCIDDPNPCPGAFAAWGAILGILPGLVVGGVAGAITKADRWEEIPLDRLRVSLGPQRDGRFGLGLSVRF